MNHCWEVQSRTLVLERMKSPNSMINTLFHDNIRGEELSHRRLLRYSRLFQYNPGNGEGLHEGLHLFRDIQTFETLGCKNCLEVTSNP